MEKIHSDVQSELKSDLIELNRVGMSDVQIGIQVSGLLIPAQLSVFVDLKSGHRGIHMSRLYEIILQTLNNQDLNKLNWTDLLSYLVESQRGLSKSSVVTLNFERPLLRSSLKSGLQGHRNYKIKSIFSYDLNRESQAMIQQQEFEIIYSSTCPQSTSLAKELTKNHFADKSDRDVSEWVQSNPQFLATPHAQRSRMNVTLQSKSPTVLDVYPWIEKIEQVLKTPVQTAVKKADEMEFARLNAENPMFCEDALRRVANALLGQGVFHQLATETGLIAYKIETSHEESLHAHNAAGMIKTKNYLQF